MKLECPEEALPQVLPEPEPIQWCFENFSENQLEKFIVQADLTRSQKNLLLGKERWKALTNGWQISPPIEVVRDMSPSARQAIYSVLRQSLLNPHIQYPKRFEARSFEEWLEHSGLSPENQQLFRSMTFREGNSVYFCDGLLMPWLCTAKEKKSLARAFSQTSTLLLKLRITPQSDMKTLLDYWGRGRQGNAMRPFLQALDEIPGGVSANVSYFFPTFARLRLYTFPDICTNSMTHRKNCFYTAMNFFNETPNFSFLNPEVVAAKLKSDYSVVTTNLILGDVLALVDNQNRIIHMCVHIADDVVFTKNGATPLAPWVLMKRAEMLEEYPPEHPLRMIAYRKKI